METNKTKKKVYSHPEIYSLGSVKNLTQVKSGWDFDQNGKSRKEKPPKELDLLDGLDLLEE